MKWWLIVLYILCAVFGVFCIHEASAQMGAFDLYDARHSVAFYSWEIAGGLFLLIAAIGVFLFISEIGLDE